MKTSVVHLHLYRAMLAGAVCLSTGISLATSAHAQTTQPQRPIGLLQNKPGAAIPLAPPIQPTNPQAVPLMQQPPSQAVIQATGGKLRIEASNASLTQTLQRISETTGMKVDGVSGDERVFGTFGPGMPKDVLATLLDGTSYNVIMVGTLTGGAPRELLLSQKDKSPAASGTGVVQQSAPQSAGDDDSAPDQQQEDPQPASPPPGRPMAPGPGGQMQPRSPQDLLQQLRQQQQQQQQSQPN